MDYQLPPSANMWVDWKEEWVYPTVCTDFKLVEHIVGQEKEVDLLSYASRYKELPSFARYSGSNIPSLVNLPDCHDEKLKSAWQFLVDLHCLQGVHPFAALRLVTILLCINPHVPKFSTDDLAALFSKYLQDERLDKFKRIEFVARCRKQAANAFMDVKFRLPLTPLFIDACEENPQWGLKLFEETSSCLEFLKVCGVVDGDESFAAFATLVKKERPFYYTQALLKLIDDKSDVAVADAKEAAAELYQILFAPDSAYYIAPELICRNLILFSSVDEPWYLELGWKLLEIEKSKESSDDFSRRNCFIIASNYQNNQSLITEVSGLYHHLVRSYDHCDFEFAYAYRGHAYPYYVRSAHPEPGPDFVPLQYFKHVTEIYESVAQALSSNAYFMRNKGHLAPACCPLVEDSLVAYWELIEFLCVHNRRVCLYVLASLLSDSNLKNLGNLKSINLGISAYYESPKLGDLAVRSVERLIKEFLIYSETYFDQSIKFLEYMIKSSVINRYVGRNRMCKPINYVLNEVYPVIERKAPELALNAVNNALVVESTRGHGATAVWKPSGWQEKN